jgi:hypothetical protein
LKGQPYYSFVHKNAQFMALDSDQDLRVGSAQYQWLEHELATSKSQWKIVYLHYPMYGSHQGEFPEIRAALQPLMAKYGVQLAIEGHEHNYSRSKPIDGVVHVLTGGGGQQVYPFTNAQQPWTARRSASFHHTEVSVSADSLTVRAIDDKGALIDAAVIPYTGPRQAAEGAANLVSARHGRRKARPQVRVFRPGTINRA